MLAEVVVPVAALNRDHIRVGSVEVMCRQVLRQYCCLVS